MSPTRANIGKIVAAVVCVMLCTPRVLVKSWSCRHLPCHPGERTLNWSAIDCTRIPSRISQAEMLVGLLFSMLKTPSPQFDESFYRLLTPVMSCFASILCSCTAGIGVLLDWASLAHMDILANQILLLFCSPACYLCVADDNTELRWTQACWVNEGS